MFVIKKRLQLIALCLLFLPAVKVQAQIAPNAPTELRITSLGGGGNNNDEEINLFLLPDTQALTRNRCDNPPWIEQACLSDLQASVDWVCNNATTRNIKGVIGLGDIVEWGPSEGDWANADTIFDSLEACDMPFVPTIGNHDFGDNHDSPHAMWNVPESQPAPTGYENWTEHMRSRLPGKSWFRAFDGTHAVPDFQPGNSFWIEAAPGIGIISIGWGAWHSTQTDSDSDRNFLSTVAASNPSIKFVIVSHGATLFDGRQQSHWITPAWVLAAIDSNPNIIAVVGGHWTACGATCGDSSRDYWAPHTAANSTVLVGYMNYASFPRDRPFYNWNGMLTIKPASNEVCIRSMRVHPLPVVYDFDSQTPGGVEMCVTYG